MKFIRYILFILLILISHFSSAQKIGLVLSGGGAKGLTHIGVIRALEENNIPIDYITGTSMGAIVGSLYAMGYSPDEMEELLRSKEFQYWYTGEVEKEHLYYFKRNEPTSEFINIKFSTRDSLKLRPQILPKSMIDPIQMNLAFMQLFSQAETASKSDFDNLFVPFRCIASDVYNKKQVVFKIGSLADAVRASMSFPFVFKPLEIDSVLIYDGGIYNNFPTDVMMEDFNPDLMIGVVVASGPKRLDINDIMSQMENMIMQKTDYTIPDSLGLALNFRFDDITLLDFHRIDELVQIGYDETISKMDSIKSRVNRFTTAENLSLRRKIYKSHYPELKFKNIYISGTTPEQERYIKKEFYRNLESDYLSFEDIKKVYFRLLAGNIISEIEPHASYNYDDNMYDLFLDVTLEEDFIVRFGGSISSTVSNQIYIGGTFQNLNNYAKEFTFDGQLGKIYNSAQLAAKIDLPTKIPTSLKLIATYNDFDYFKRDKLFSSGDIPAFNKSREMFLKLKIALPFMSNRKTEFGFGIGKLEDRYFQSRIIDFDEDRFDISNYFLWGGNISFTGNTLTNKQFPIDGYKEALIAQVYTGREKYKPHNKTEGENVKENYSWLQISYKRESYHSMSKNFILGWMVEGLYSSKNFSNNYSATMMQAGSFTPTPHSKILYNEHFRANQFVAAGIKPIVPLNKLFHLRTELYGFLPIFSIKQSSDNKAYYSKSFSDFEYMGEISLVCHLPFLAISAYLNHYSSPKNEWNVGLTIGWQLFNNKFIE